MRRISICLIAGLCAFPATAAPARGMVRSGPGAGAAHCADSLRPELDMASLAPAGSSESGRMPSSRQLETLRLQAGQRFKAVANAMCARGELRPAQLAPYRRLLIEQADGADSSAFMSGGREHGRDALVFQFVYDQGAERVSYAVPAEADVRDGLLCWSAWARHRRMCEGRLP